MSAARRKDGRSDTFFVTETFCGSRGRPALLGSKDIRNAKLAFNDITKFLTMSASQSYATPDDSEQAGGVSQ